MMAMLSGMSGASEALWGRFATVAGLDVVDEGSSSNERRVALPADLIDEIEDAFVAEEAESWLARLADAGVPAAWLDAVDQAQRADGSSP